MKQHLIKNNFSAGELAPTLYTRTDIQQYANGAKELTNVIPLVEGGVKKRPGTYFLSLAENSHRLVPFIVNSSDTFALIFRDGFIDVFNPRTKSIITSIISPYTASQIHDIQYVQYRYEMFLTHNEVPVYRFMCNENFANWQLIQFVYSHAPTDSENARFPFRKGKPSGKDVGAQISFTLSGVNEWLTTQTYLVGDVISYVGAYYQATQDSTNKQPNTETSYWAVVTEGLGAVFTAADVGSYIDVNGGIIKITQLVNADQVNGEVVKKLDADVLAIERAWSIMPPAFNTTNGYPRCCTYFKQRLALANTKKNPNKIWFSAVGGNGNYLETTEDGDAFSIVSASGLSNSILFLEAQRGVVCLTSGGEFMVDSDGVLSPTTVNINEHSAYGAYPSTRPERVGNELLFVQRGGERLRALTYRFEVDGLVSPEVSSLASHIGENHLGINELSYMQEPESLVWCVLGDGKVASITFNRDQEVVAWAQHDFGGVVLSICSVPTKLGKDRSFMLISRNGTTCLEEISFDAYLDSQREVVLSDLVVSKGTLVGFNSFDAFFNDGQYIYQVQFAEKETQMVFPEQWLNKTLNIGQTINCKAVMFPPELNQNPISSLMFKAKIERIGLFFHKTISPEINGELVEQFNYSDGEVWEPREPHTGYHLIEGGTWEDLHKLPFVVTHNKPLPFHLQAISMQISINEK